MNNLNPDIIQELITKAFVLEALTDKPGCTTRYSDLPAKPLQDFVIAGINCSRHVSLLAKDLQKNPTAELFARNVAALRASNSHKSTKYINFGLLEIIFPTVYARIKCDDPTKVVDNIIDSVKTSTNADVRHILQARDIAWSTSETPHKANFDPHKYEALDSVWDFYMAFMSDFGPETSNYQWANQYKEGLPILRAFFDAYTQMGEVMTSTKKVFEEQKNENPMVAVGILADMCAAAIFLWLSFNDRPV